MVSMAMGKPPLVARWSSPRSGGFTGPSRKALRQLISWKPATVWKAARSRVGGRGGRSITTQPSTTASPRRMVPPLITEA